MSRRNIKRINLPLARLSDSSGLFTARKATTALAALALMLTTPADLLAEKIISESKTGRLVLVQKGDTLSLLAKKFLGDPMKWHALMRHNDIKDPNVIDPGIELEIPFSLESAKASPAEVVFATPMEIYYDYQRQGRHLGDGDFIPPSGRVSANDGTALLKLPDSSKFHLEKEAIIQMNGFFENKQEDGSSIFKTFLKSVEGRVKFEVSKVIGGGEFEVETPTGIIKVKGTEFAIEIKEDADTAIETYHGLVALQLGESNEELDIAAGEGTVVPKDATSLSQVTKVKLLSAPILSEDPVQQGKKTIFSWEEVEGAKEYMVFAAGDDEMSAPVKLGIAEGQESVAVRRLPPGEYHWNVVAVDQYGLRSPAAEPRVFTIQ